MAKKWGGRFLGEEDGVKEIENDQGMITSDVHDMSEI